MRTYIKLVLAYKFCVNILGNKLESKRWDTVYLITVQVYGII